MLLREQSGLCIFIKWQLALQSVKMRFCSSEEEKNSVFDYKDLQLSEQPLVWESSPKIKKNKKPKAKQKTVLTSFWIYSFVIASMEDLSPHWCPKCVLCLFDSLFNWLTFDIELDDSFTAVLIYIFASTMEKRLHEIWQTFPEMTSQQRINYQPNAVSKRKKSQRLPHIKKSETHFLANQHFRLVLIDSNILCHVFAWRCCKSQNYMGSFSVCVQIINRVF